MDYFVLKPQIKQLCKSTSYTPQDEDKCDFLLNRQYRADIFDLQAKQCYEQTYIKKQFFLLTQTFKKLSLKRSLPLGTCTLNKNTHVPLLKLLEKKGISNFVQIKKELSESCSHFENDSDDKLLIKIISELCALKYINPCPSPKKFTARQESCRNFNLSLENDYKAEQQLLVSPLLASAFKVSLYHKIFCQSLLKQEDPKSSLFEYLHNNKLTLNKNDQALKSKAEINEAIETEWQNFVNNHQDEFLRLGVLTELDLKAT